jgi:glycine/D-amino acid oxidase-like deaminating enzyme
VIIVGAGILGLCVAEAASRSGIKVDVLDSSHAPAASMAAAAQLGMKGQSLSRSGVFAIKLGGQRCYESWLESWDGPGPKSWFRRGWGRDRVLSDAECAEQMRRVAKHESDAGTSFYGPGLAFLAPSHREILYLQEACVDAPLMLARLRAALVSRGVRFWEGDACDKETMIRLLSERYAVCGDMRDPAMGLRSIVLAAGAWSFEILNAWGGTAGLGIDLSSVRYSLGGTLVLRPGDIVKTTGDGVLPDFERFAVEGLIDRSQREIAIVTEHVVQAKHTVHVNEAPAKNAAAGASEQRLTSLNFATASGMMVHRGQLAALSQAVHSAEIERMKSLFERHGLAIEQSSDQLRQEIRCGIRMRTSSRDFVIDSVDVPGELAACCYDAGFASMQKLPRVILFTGANRSGYVYGPMLASRIVDLDLRNVGV